MEGGPPRARGRQPMSFTEEHGPCCPVRGPRRTRATRSPGASWWVGAAHVTVGVRRPCCSSPQEPPRALGTRHLGPPPWLLVWVPETEGLHL